MEKKIIERVMKENEFYHHFCLLKNHLNGNAPFDGCMYETYGRELEFILMIASNPNTSCHLWTIIEGDEDTLMFESGYHYVNRIGYLMTEEPINKNETITVMVEK